MLNKEGSGIRDQSSSETAGLILRAQAGDRDAFEQLIILHQRLVLGAACHLLHHIEDARDAAQEVFLKLYRNLSRIRPEADLRRWLYRVTVNACHDIARKLHQVPMVSLESDPGEHETVPSSETGIDAVLDLKDPQRRRDLR